MSPIVYTSFSVQIMVFLFLQQTAARSRELLTQVSGNLSGGKQKETKKKNPLSSTQTRNDLDCSCLLKIPFSLPIQGVKMDRKEFNKIFELYDKVMPRSSFPAALFRLCAHAIKRHSQKQLSGFS